MFFCLSAASGTLHDDLRTFHCCQRNKFSTKALVCNSEYFCMAASDVQQNHTHTHKPHTTHTPHSHTHHTPTHTHTHTHTHTPHTHTPPHTHHTHTHTHRMHNCVSVAKMVVRTQYCVTNILPILLVGNSPTSSAAKISPVEADALHVDRRAERHQA